MPRLNSNGRLAGGIDGTTISVDKVPVSFGTQVCWLSADEIAYQRTPQNILEAYHIKTAKKRQLDLKGANYLAAGGGLWAAWAGKFRHSKGYGHPEMGLIPGGMNQNGDCLIRHDYQSGKGLAILKADGTITDLVVDSVCGDPAWTADNHVVYTLGGEIKWTGDKSPVQVARAYEPQILRISGELWVFYHTDDELLLHPFDSTIGYRLVATPTTFHPSAVVADATTVLYAWSDTQGESPTHLHSDLQSIRAKRIELKKVALPPSSPPPPMPIIPPDIKDFVLKRLAQLGLARVNGGNNDETRAKTFEALNQLASELAAKDPRYGLLEKKSGNRWRDRSIDTLTWKDGNTSFESDVISDGEGVDGNPRPSFSGWSPSDASRWVPPYSVSTSPTPPSPSAPAPPPPPAIDLKPLLEAQLATIAKLEELKQAIVAAVSDLKAEVAKGIKVRF